MTDYLARLSGFDVVMWVVAIGCAGLVAFLVISAQRLKLLRETQAMEQELAAETLSPEDLETIRRVAERLRTSGNRPAREDRPA